MDDPKTKDQIEALADMLLTGPQKDVPHIDIHSGASASDVARELDEELADQSFDMDDENESEEATTPVISHHINDIDSADPDEGEEFHSTLDDSPIGAVVAAALDAANADLVESGQNNSEISLDVDLGTSETGTDDIPSLKPDIEHPPQLKLTSDSATFQPTIVEALLPGHLPGYASPWISQYAFSLAREHGSTLMLRVDQDAISLDLFELNSDNSSTEASTDTADRRDVETYTDSAKSDTQPLVNLFDKLTEYNGSISAYLLVAADEKVPMLKSRIGALNRWTLLTGSDDAAIVGAYQILKNYLGGPDARMPRRGVRVMFMGCDEEQADAALARINVAAATFLDTAVQLAGVQKRMQPIRRKTIGRFERPSDLDPLPTLLDHLENLAAIVEQPAPAATKSYDEDEPLLTAEEIEALTNPDSPFVATDADQSLVTAATDINDHPHEDQSTVSHDEVFQTDAGDEVSTLKLTPDTELETETEDQTQSDETETDSIDSVSREESQNNQPESTPSEHSSPQTIEFTEESQMSPQTDGIDTVKPLAQEPANTPDIPDLDEINDQIEQFQPTINPNLANEGFPARVRKRDFSTFTTEKESASTSQRPENPPSPSTTPAAQTADLDLSPYVPSTHLLEARCPSHNDVQITLNTRGQFEFLLRAQNQPLSSALRTLIETAAWAQKHKDLIQLTCRDQTIAPTTEPILHLFADSAKSGNELLLTGLLDQHTIKLHLLKPVTVGSTTVHVHEPLN